ncbi:MULTISPECIES: caspase family protein [unclassified Chryseobacterium]|uniref:caspase family protein n=1 Tax=unclassified Chryseobacterium TaxID=2593645 RepID=UPI000D372D49|nr:MULTISPECIES: caspase family protein [unclassified Chryseobacterium]PTT67081.1 hypothetical protein DBR25_21615 [Chryseobacterium sp. HMWF001]PVV50403.1 caspase family protein [Chryseobacterium sp. HMWF035]
MAKKYVIVGANTDIYGEYPSLPGAQKSALDWKSFLDKEGFEQREILTDQTASRENILPALTSLFSNLKKDDFAVFIYIGHGNQIKDEYKNYKISLDEDDGLDEILVCNGNSITDDEIRILLTLNKRKAPVFILIDACYNGVVENKLQTLNHFPENNEIAFSSATQIQVAYMENHNKNKQAIFSTFLLKALTENSDKNYNEIFDLTVDSLKHEGYTQDPQMAFTNDIILANPFFKTPINTNLKISQSVWKEVIENPHKGQTELANEKYKILIGNEVLKTIHKIKINNLINPK